MRSMVKGFLHSWSLHSNTRPTWICTNQQQCIQYYCPALLKFTHCITRLKDNEVNLICFIIAVCPCPLLRTENSADRVLEGESQGVTIRRWWTSGGGSYDGLGTICDIQNHSPFLTLVYSLSLKWIAFLSVPCSSDYVIPYLRLKSIRGWNLGKCKLKEPLFSRHPSTNQPSPA